MDLWDELKDLRQQLNVSVEELKKTGNDYAVAYRDYRMLLAKRLLQLKAEGMPVTMAYDVARGDTLVANAKLKEIATESLYKACQENINSIKIQIKILENQINREWSQAVM